MAQKPTITVDVSFKTPSLPNFITLDVLAASGASSSLLGALTAEAKTVPVGLLTDEAIETVIEQWAQDFREHCKAKREAKDGQGS